MRYSLVRAAMLGAFLFSVPASGFSPTIPTNVRSYRLEVLLNEGVGALPTLLVFLHSPYLTDKGLSPFQIESILRSAAKESDVTRDPLRYHILEVKIAQVETILYNTLLSARQHLKENDALDYEHMRDKNEERMRIHQDITTAIKQTQWGFKNNPTADEALTTDPSYDIHAERWGAFALTADNHALEQVDIEVLLDTYWTNMEQQDLGSPYYESGVANNHYDLEDGLAHVATLLNNHPNDGEILGRSKSYIFDIIYALREHVDVRKVAMLYAFKHHLRRQQVDLMYARTSDYRPDISGAWRKNRGQEDFGVSLYHLYGR